ncbi:MAG: hypothetical protein HUJ52_04085 [Malacoplasma sp.]|nr:hypothetical protein [Malacoplasma sp.]
MKKNKIVSSILLGNTLLAATSVAAFTTSCSTNIEEYFFKVETDDLEVEFCDIGASIYSIQYKDTYITYAPKNKQQFLDIDYYGNIVGRLPGRIAEGRIKVGDKTYQLEVNEADRNNSLHGGKNCFSVQKFNRYVEETDDKINVSFNYVSPANEAGYPELLDCWVVYTIYKNIAQIDTQIYAKTTGTTPVNITNHPYFRLANSGDILEHELTVPADKKAIYDEDLRIVGQEDIESLKEFDFNLEKEIGKDIEAVATKEPVAKGYDHMFIFTNNNPIHKITLRNPDNELTLEIETDAEAACLYTNNYPKDNLEILGGGNDVIHGSIAVEPQSYFKGNDTSMLNIDANNSFTRYISYKLFNE